MDLFATQQLEFLEDALCTLRVYLLHMPRRELPVRSPRLSTFNIRSARLFSDVQRLDFPRAGHTHRHRPLLAFALL